MPLHDHPGNANNVGARTSIEVNWLDILIDQRDPMLARRERSEQGQRCDRHIGALTYERQRVFKAKERNFEFRIDQDDICHYRLLVAGDWGVDWLIPQII